jgi:hypothetical protein
MHILRAFPRRPLFSLVPFLLLGVGACQEASSPLSPAEGASFSHGSSHNTRVTWLAVPSSAPYRSTVTLTAHVERESCSFFGGCSWGNLQGATVLFRANGGEIGQAVTASDGIASADIVLPPWVQGGIAELRPVSRAWTEVTSPAPPLINSLP